MVTYTTATALWQYSEICKFKLLDTGFFLLRRWFESTITRCTIIAMTFDFTQRKNIVIDFHNFVWYTLFANIVIWSKWKKKMEKTLKNCEKSGERKGLRGNKNWQNLCERERRTLNEKLSTQPVQHRMDEICGITCANVWKNLKSIESKRFNLHFLCTNRI